MQVGKFVIEQLSEGFFELFPDGTFKKMDSDRIDRMDEDQSIGTYSSAVGIDPLFLADGKTNIVVDPGLGWGLDHKSSFGNTSNVVTNLDIFSIKPEDIDIVILTHLHYDHSAGCTYNDRDFKTSPVFPNARYLVQKSEWEYALHQTGQKRNHAGAGYHLDELYRLAADDRFEWLDKDLHYPVNGLELIKTGGHTPGHMVVKITDRKNSALFLGDLVPNEYQLNHYVMKQADTDPLQSKKMKTRLLNDAFQNRSALLFYHSLYRKSGRLSKDKRKQYVLLDI